VVLVVRITTLGITVAFVDAVVAGASEVEGTAVGTGWSAGSVVVVVLGALVWTRVLLEARTATMAATRAMTAAAVPISTPR
jgi:hypothetical protein